MNSKKVIFITGPGHSGSTLLGLILGSHSQMFGLGEIINIPKAFQENNQSPKICYICHDSCSFWNQPDREIILRQYSTPNTLLNMFRNWRGEDIQPFPYEYLFDWTDAEILVDFSKPLKWVKKQFQNISTRGYATPILLYNVRDGRAVVNSYLRKYPDRNIEVTTQRWRKTIIQCNEFYNTAPPDQRRLVRYEAVVTQPEVLFSELCALLKVEYEPAMLEYWKHAHHTVYGNTGTRSLIWRYQTQQNQTPISVDELSKANHSSYDSGYYDSMGLSIELDLRWKQEMSVSQLVMFETIAGDLNHSFAFDSTTDLLAEM